MYIYIKLDKFTYTSGSN